MGRVVVWGSINQDVQIEVVEFPRPGETVQSVGHRVGLGGKGANQAVAASRAGAIALLNVFVIKEWMGHKRIETTLRYAHVKPQNLEDALVRVGDLKVAALKKAEISDVSIPPHIHPTGGVKPTLPMRHR